MECCGDVDMLGKMYLDNSLIGMSLITADKIGTDVWCVAMRTAARQHPAQERGFEHLKDMRKADAIDSL